jgi:hypothetical protein
MAALTIDQIEHLLNRGDYVYLHPDGGVTIAERDGMKQEHEELVLKYDKAARELRELKVLLNTPETEDFDKGVPLEAGHQIQRWGAQHDAGKQPEDWFWLCGYLAGKALSSMKAGDTEKAKHHCISTAAAMRNWHRHIATGESAMRPGISAEKASVGGDRAIS